MPALSGRMAIKRPLEHAEVGNGVLPPGGPESE
jgi:hypothetical protein